MTSLTQFIKRRIRGVWKETKRLFYSEYGKALSYVGSTRRSYNTVGLAQLELLKMNGCQPASHVLEIGCGCLVAGIPIMKYLGANRYAGIEPNAWLIDAVRKGFPGASQLFEQKRPIFLTNLEFDGSSAGRQFDYVISHSILSHAAHWQYPLFLKSIKKCLALNGVVLASIRFHNDAGELMGDSNDEAWVYPGASYFSWETVQRVATEHGLRVEWRKDYREFFMDRCPGHYHDWVRITLNSSQIGDQATRK